MTGAPGESVVDLRDPALTAGIAERVAELLAGWQPLPGEEVSPC